MDVISQGYMPGYEDKDLENMEDDMAPLSQDLANRIADAVLPRGVTDQLDSGQSAKKLVMIWNKYFVFRVSHINDYVFFSF
jgi:hypothetical protein